MPSMHTLLQNKTSYPHQHACISFDTLFRHQFASHVCQTFLKLAADVVEREVLKTTVLPDTVDPELAKELPLMQDILEQLCRDITDWSALMRDAYASHVVRTLLNVLTGESLLATEMRSKASIKYNLNHQNEQLVKHRLFPIRPRQNTL